MGVGEAKVSWIVCHQATRSVSRAQVHCPMRGVVSCAACLACRFLMTSSVEREFGPWCEAWSTPHRVARPVRARVPVPIAAEPLAPPPADLPLRLPVLVVRPAVHPPAPVPSGHLIGT